MPLTPFHRDNYRLICGFKKQFEIALAHHVHCLSVVAHSARTVDAGMGPQCAEGQVPQELW